MFDPCAAETVAPLEVDLDDDEQVDRALRAAVRNALREHKEAGQYVVSWQDGQIVHIPAEDIVVPGEDI